METNFPPSPRMVLPALSPVFALLAPALSVGCDASLKVFEQSFKLQRPDEPWLFAHLARYVALRKMKQDGIDDLGFELAEIAHSGIFIHNSEYDIRVLKATYRVDRESGEPTRAVPNPGTVARREYFEQPSFPTGASLDLGIASRLKLVALWDHDTTFQLAHLDLAAPRRWTQSTNCVDLHWLEPIPELHQDVHTVAAPKAPRIQLEDISVQDKDADQLTAADATGSR